MDLKKSLALLLVILASQHIFSQKIMHSIGINASISTSDWNQRDEIFVPPNVTVINSTVRLNRLSVNYFPRLGILKSRNTSLSIGIPICAGISWAATNNSSTYSFNPLSSTAFLSYPTTYTTGEKNPHFAIELPAVVDFNIGLGSSSKNNKRVGMYIGAGYAYSYTSFSIKIDPVSISSYDPLVHAGFRFRITSKQKFTVGFSYKRYKQFGVQLLKDL